MGSKAGAAAGCGRSAQGRLPGVRPESPQVCQARGQVAVLHAPQAGAHVSSQALSHPFTQ